jgi:hypothetical protein
LLANSTIFAPFNLDGQTMIQSPKFRTSVNVDLAQPINDRFRLVGNLLWAYNSKRKLVNATTPLGPLWHPGYSLVNIRAGVRTR